MKRSGRQGGGLTARSQPSATKTKMSDHSQLINQGGKNTTIDTNLDKNATSLTERREVAALYYDKDVIAPLWMKVSSTPWTAMARASGGYGKVVHDTSVSHDCPSFMHIPEVMAHEPMLNAGGEFGSSAKRKVTKRNTYTISEDAPAWFHVPSSVAWKAKTLANPKSVLGHRKMVLGKEILFEPNLKEENNAEIDWQEEERVMTAAMGKAKVSARGGGSARGSARGDYSARGMGRSESARSGGGGGGTARGNHSTRGETARDSARRMMFEG